MGVDACRQSRHGLQGGVPRRPAGARTDGAVGSLFRKLSGRRRLKVNNSVKSPGVHGSPCQEEGWPFPRIVAATLRGLRRVQRHCDARPKGITASFIVCLHGITAFIAFHCITPLFMVCLHGNNQRPMLFESFHTPVAPNTLTLMVDMSLLTGGRDSWRIWPSCPRNAMRNVPVP